MKPSEAYMHGFHQGCQGFEKDEIDVPEKCLAAYGDGFEYGQTRRQMAKQEAGYFDTLDEVNKKAFAMWNINGQHPELPDPPSGSGCRQHYCWMPADVVGRYHACKAHGGRDCPLPKANR